MALRRTRGGGGGSPWLVAPAGIGVSSPVRARPAKPTEAGPVTGAGGQIRVCPSATIPLRPVIASGPVRLPPVETAQRPGRWASATAYPTAGMRSGLIRADATTAPQDTPRQRSRSGRTAANGPRP